MKYLVFALSIALVSCSTGKPKFQKGTPGYTLEGPVGTQGFRLKTDLGPNANDKYSVYYGYRAVGEECLARGFQFFDVAVVDPHHFEGYCYKTADHPALAVEFTERGLDARPQHFVVHDLFGKTNTQLQKGDEILAIDEAPPLSVSTFKSMVFRAASANRKFVTLKIKRDEKELEIKEPIALFKNSSLGSTQLDLVRSQVE